MLHCSNEFQMEVCSFCFKFDEMVPRNGNIISGSFSGAAENQEVPPSAGQNTREYSVNFRSSVC